MGDLQMNGNNREVAFNNIDLPKTKKERNEMINEIKLTLFSLLYYATYKTSLLPENEKREIIKKTEPFTIDEMAEYLSEEKFVPDKRLQNRVDEVMDYLETIQNNKEMKRAAFKNLSALTLF